ncbi:MULTISPECIES: sugar ABC transporter substrate-binding protein [unclassified Nocardioides]|uniref:sugar ABC transporter substrate-binding protein n=1 Tax=unclassified Nocardioides TaxID=2615069 RepID=UPI0009F04C21|nr:MULTISPECIES: sugar ABC transporter substrate-binding protein [unclassified Nocardioides]GAW47700.1 sugar ABC transporter periplasmic component-like protein [Nocardioides sp. PD653-B2]GAW56870.1 sugar ABC transporter periplasmic component-like protein [Nocardioides sp. PD653]
MKKQILSALGVRPRRRLTIAALLLPLALAGCSSPGESSSTSSESAKGEVSQAATDTVEKFKSVTDFVSPGPAVDVASLAGKSVFVIPLLTTNDYNIQINAAMERVAELADVDFEVYTNEGQPNQWVAGMNQAIAKGVDVIILSGGTDPRALEPQIKEARDRGIKVVVSMFWDTSAQYAPDCSGLSVDCVDGVDAIVAAPYQTATRLNADWIAVDSDGAANILVVTSNDAGPSPGQEAAFKDEIATACPSCETTFANVPISKWTTSVQSTVQSELVRNPDIDYVVPLYDNMASYAVAGITAAGKQGQVQVVTFNGTPAVLKMIQDGDVVTMDVGESLEGAGFAAMDNAFRLMAGMEPSRVADIVPVRIFDTSNIDEAGTPPEVNKGYGDDLEAQYLEVWGLG